MKKIFITSLDTIDFGKHPISPTKDNKHLFVTKYFFTLKSAFEYMSKHTTLSKSLDYKKTPLNRIERRHDVLKEFYPKRLTNIAFDLDKIYSAKDRDSVIKFLDDKDFSIVLAMSKSYSDENEYYSMKGILRVDFEYNSNDTKLFFKELQREIDLKCGKICEIDLAICNNVSTQTSIDRKVNILLLKEDGKFIPSHNDIKIQKTVNILTKIDVDVEYSDAYISKCLEIFAELNYTVKKSTVNANGSINFKHISEVKSEGGFFWFQDNPTMMHHNNQTRSVSIFGRMKDTEEGKEYYKEFNKQKIKESVLNSPYKKDYIINHKVNKRYLKIDDTITSMIDKLIDSNNDVLKIKSPMGTAKSTIIEEVIRKAELLEKKVIIVTNRISLAKDFSSKYNIKMYNEVNDYWDKSLIVQFDSLHRFNLKHFDIVIFDEFMSLLLHHRNNLTNNNNINSVKFKILMDRKRVVIADAFLLGYEDIFFNDRNLMMIDNHYRDDISLTKYTNREHFCSTLIEDATLLKNDKCISASFTSLKALKAVNRLLNKQGIKTITLTSETPSYKKEHIYNIFSKENQDEYKVILYTPTLTVGVSNLNNIDKHYHYDGSSFMGVDVISSLQMIKRSRKVKEIHFFNMTSNMHLDMNHESLNKTAQLNISKYYKGENGTLLIDIDWETGDLQLTELAKYINKIEAFNNTLSSNHSFAFELLLKMQFKNNPLLDDIINETWSLKDAISEIKIEEQKEKEKILEMADITWNDIEIKNIQNKTEELNDLEKTKLHMDALQKKFRLEVPLDLLKKLLEKSDINGFIHSVRHKKAFIESFSKDSILSNSIGSNIKTLQNQSYIEYLEYIGGLKSIDIKLSNTFSHKRIALVDEQMMSIGFKGKGFSKFLKKIGYNKEENSYVADKDVNKFMKYI